MGVLYETLSPFEIKNVLGDMAEKAAKKLTVHGRPVLVLNAGRGNPNFINTTVREAYAQLSYFSAELAEQSETISDLGLRPEKKGIAEKLSYFISLANLNDEDYTTIGKNISEVMEEYFKSWKDSKQ